MNMGMNCSAVGRANLPKRWRRRATSKCPLDTFAEEIWFAEEHAECGGRQVYTVTSA
jgi:hypothetical protein